MLSYDLICCVSVGGNVTSWERERIPPCESISGAGDDTDDTVGSAAWVSVVSVLEGRSLRPVKVPIGVRRVLSL